MKLIRKLSHDIDWKQQKYNKPNAFIDKNTWKKGNVEIDYCGWVLFVYFSIW